MLEAGIINEDDRVELIGGELVAMSPKGRLHEVLKVELNAFWFARRPPDLMIAPETSLHLGDNDLPEPDFIVYPASILAPDVRWDTVLLVVEVADSSLNYDLKFKAARYAAAGVRDYWVINARDRTTTIFRGPQADASYAHRTEHAADMMLTPLLAIPLAVRLADLRSA